MEAVRAQGGTQLLDRAVAVLRHLAAAGERGERLSSVAQALGLSVPTTHRILAALEGHGLVEREVATRLFRLGVGVFSLGAQAADGTGLRRLCRPALLRLSAATDETVFLMVRSGLDTVCVDRQEGSYMLETLTRQVGGVIPLGVGSGSMSILSYLPEPEIAAVLQANGARYERFGLTAARVASFLPEIRATGYAMTLDLMIEGLSAVAVPIRPVGRDVVAALTINLTTARLTAGRHEVLLGLLRDEISEIERQLSID